MNLNRKSGIPQRLARRSIRLSMKCQNVVLEEENQIEITKEQKGMPTGSCLHQIHQDNILNDKCIGCGNNKLPSKIAQIKKPMVVKFEKPEKNNDKLINNRKSILKVNQKYDFNGMQIKENKVDKIKHKSGKSGSKFIEEESIEAIQQLLNCMELEKESFSNVLASLKELKESI